MSSELTAAPKTIQEIGSNYEYVVPAYQREYVWDAKKNFLKLLQDIYEEWQENLNKIPQSKYFLGSIITVRSEGQTCYEVVDGQQRLTSIIIFLAAFINYVNEQNYTDTQDIRRKDRYTQLILDVLLTNNQDDIKVKLQYDNTTNYLKHLVFSDKTEYNKDSQSVKKMSKAYATAYKFIREQLGEKDIWSFINYFLKNVQLLVVTDTTNFANSLKIFETINNTGVNLKGMDLVKNLIFMQTTPNQYKDIKSKWSEIIKNLKNCGEDQKPSRFLRYFIISRYYDQNSTLTEQNTYNWIADNDKGKKIIDYDKNPESFINEILWYSELYSDLVVATTNNGVGDIEKIKKYPWIYNIGLLNNSAIRQHLIIFLSINKTLLSTENKKIKIINKIAEQIEKLLFWYQLSSVQPKEIEVKFQGLAKIIREQKNESDLVSEIHKFYSKEKEDMNQPSWDMVDSLSHSKIRYILLRIENFLRGAAKMSRLPLDTQVSLEHIFPQTPLNNIEPFENYNMYVNNFGNYTLLETNLNSSIARQNDVLSSHWFIKKSSIYQTSDYLITRIFTPHRKTLPRSKHDQFLSQFPPVTKWNKDVVEKRKDALINLAKATWK